MNKKVTLYIFLFFIIISGDNSALAKIYVEAFGSNGHGGELNYQKLTFGTFGKINELDGYINIADYDLNGEGRGTSRALTEGLPNMVDLKFASELSPDNSTLNLSYCFTNTSLDTLSDFEFFFFIDAQITDLIYTKENMAAWISSASNEYGEISGIIGKGKHDPYPDSWEIDDPQNPDLSENIIEHLYEGILDNKNTAPSSTPKDVSYALGFQLGTLEPAESKAVSIVLSDKDKFIEPFSLRHVDKEESDFLTMSGQVSECDTKNERNEAP